MDDRRPTSIPLRSCAKFTLFCVSVLIACISASCKDSVQLFEPYPEPTAYRASLLPLAIGNSWRYVDSSRVPSGGNVFSYWNTDSVSRFTVVNGRYWWTIGFGSDQYSVDGDTVFVKPFLGQPFPLYIPTPPAGDTQHVNWQPGETIAVNVYAMPGSITVPAGTFDHCAVYEFDSYGGHSRDVFKPGVGIVYRERTSQWDTTAVNRMYLFAFTLMR